MLLQIGQLLSNVGTQTTSIAFPLLVLAVTHSPAKAGIVGFARSVPWVLFALPAGLAADRWSRRRLMILADGVRVLAIGTLAVTILLDRVAFWEVVVVAFVEGIGSALFFGAQPGALRAVVPANQLPAAAAAETGRQAVVRLAGPPLGGALFSLARAVPFVVDALSYAFSRCGRRFRRNVSRTSRRCARGSRRASTLSGASRSCARARSSSGSRTSSGPECCSP
jgi:MFS family permease